jgi:isoleucyl-tRNA synthetase
MKRIPEVLDCWMESGSMPYGERHYPFENKAVLEQIILLILFVNNIAQTRAWFYVSAVVANSLFDKKRFQKRYLHWSN